MLPSRDDGPLELLDTALNALFATEVAEEVFEAVDVEALRAGAPVDRAVDIEHLTRVLGEPTGRLVARELARQAPGGKVTEVVGREVGGPAVAFVLRRLLEQVDPEAAAEMLDRAGAPRNDFEDAVTVPVEPPSDEE